PAQQGGTNASTNTKNSRGTKPETNLLAPLNHRRRDLEGTRTAPLIAILARRRAEEVAVGAGEVRPRREAAGQADLDDRLAGLHQQLARLVQAQFQVVLAGHAIEV